MGEVYRARDTKLQRDVAVKILPTQHEHDAGARARFEQEARAVAALNHPHIVTIHNVEQRDGVDFIVMELVTGRALSQLIPGAGLPIDRAMDYGRQIAQALDAAHRANIVHRDLKPSNVMVSDAGQVKVLDFGLAKLIPWPTRPRSPPRTPRRKLARSSALSPTCRRSRRRDGPLITVRHLLIWCRAVRDAGRPPRLCGRDGHGDAHECCRPTAVAHLRPRQRARESQPPWSPRACNAIRCCVPRQATSSARSPRSPRRRCGVACRRGHARSLRSASRRPRRGRVALEAKRRRAMGAHIGRAGDAPSHD